MKLLLSSLCMSAFAISGATLAQTQEPAPPPVQQEATQVTDADMQKFAEIYVDVETKRAEIADELNASVEPVPAEEAQVRLQEELVETEQRLNELQASQGEGGALILSAEQRHELERFRARQLEIRRELRQVRRQLDADIDSLGSWLKFLNVWLLPVLLTLAVAGIVWWRRRRLQVRPA